MKRRHSEDLSTLNINGDTVKRNNNFTALLNKTQQHKTTSQSKQLLVPSSTTPYTVESTNILHHSVLTVQLLIRQLSRESITLLPSQEDIFRSSAEPATFWGTQPNNGTICNDNENVLFSSILLKLTTNYGWYSLCSISNFLPQHLDLWTSSQRRWALLDTTHAFTHIFSCLPSVLTLYLTPE